MCIGAFWLLHLSFKLLREMQKAPADFEINSFTGFSTVPAVERTCWTKL